MTDTPNARLARVLRLLADVAERGRMSYAAQLALEYASNHADERRNDTEAGIENQLILAESYATESARLAGVPLDGWRPVTAVPLDEFVLVTVRDMDIDGGKPYVCESILCESQDEGTYEWCMRPDYDDEPAPLLGGSVLAWRPLVEPYRPEEKTDEQR